MKTTLSTSLLFALVLLCASAAAQNNAGTTTTTAGADTAMKTKAKRGPVFRASKDQVKQAQAALKQRGLYGGEETGTLDDTTRAALKKYQQAESIKVTGTLNRETLEKMSITLTEKQRTM